jgi:hypothetical protein
MVGVCEEVWGGREEVRRSGDEEGDGALQKGERARRKDID